jgi:hypothetical protein
MVGHIGNCGALANYLGIDPDGMERGRSSGVEHNLAKVGVESSNLFARSIFANKALCYALFASGVISSSELRIMASRFSDIFGSISLPPLGMA